MSGWLAGPRGGWCRVSWGFSSQPRGQQEASGLTSCGLLGEAGLEGFPKEPTLLRGGAKDRMKMVLHADDGILASTNAAREKIIAQLEERVVVQVSEPFSLEQGIELLKRGYVLDHGIIMYPSAKYLDSPLTVLGNVKEREGVIYNWPFAAWLATWPNPRCRR